MKAKILCALDVKRALSAGEKISLSDGNGLRLRVDGAGRGAWLFYGKIHGTGKNCLVTLGRAPEMSLAEARGRAEDARAIAFAGQNPTAVWKARREAEQAAEETYGNVALKWFREKKSRLTERTRQGILGRLNNHILPAIGNKPFVSLARRDFVSLVRGLAGHGQFEQARRVGNILEQIDTYGANIGILDNVRAVRLSSALPDRGVGQEQKHRAAVVDPEGFSGVLRDIRLAYETQRFSLPMGTALGLLPLTGLRASELLGAAWEEFDPENAVLHVPAGRMKKRRAFDVPLSRQAMALLIRLRKYTGAQQYIFSSFGWKHPHLGSDGVLKSLRIATGLGKTDISLHGFRSTWGTLARHAGLPESVVEAGLAHKSGDGASLPYNRTDFFEARKQAAQWWADFCDALRDGKELPPAPDVFSVCLRL